ncbi:hypothetical protein TNCV_1860211 [Trichonephila clavipes]|nr:hypothetical protein TNCV_1860211 [Trichonephila clavipes]
MERKKKKCEFNLEKKPFLPSNDISVFVEETSQFAVSGRNVLMAKKKEEKRESPNPVKKDIAPSTRKKNFFSGKSKQ